MISHYVFCWPFHNAIPTRCGRVQRIDHDVGRVQVAVRQSDQRTLGRTVGWTKGEKRRKKKTWCSTSLLFFNFEFQKCVDSFFDPPKIRIANKTETQSQKKMWISHTAMAGIPFPHWREMRIWLWIWSLLQAGPSAIFGNEDLDGI